MSNGQYNTVQFRPLFLLAGMCGASGTSERSERCGCAPARSNHLRAAPSVKLQLAAIWMLFDWLVVGQVVPVNPASSVRGPKPILI